MTSENETPVRRRQHLTLIEIFYPTLDAAITRSDEIEAMGDMDCDLCCGKDGTLLLRNFTKDKAQKLFRREKMRTVIKCGTCGSYNLLAAAVEKGKDGRIVTLPHRE